MRKLFSKEKSEDEMTSGAHKIAMELMKQLITLASGVLVLSATFLERLKEVPAYLFIPLAMSWIVLIVTILFGLETISVIVKSCLRKDDAWSEGRGRISAKISKYSFVIGITLFAIFAFLSLVS